MNEKQHANIGELTFQAPGLYVRLPLHWRHNDHDDVSNHQPHGCLLNLFIETQIKENIKAPRHRPLCGEFTGTGEFPAQRASDTENVSIWLRHHAGSEFGRHYQPYIP